MAPGLQWIVLHGCCCSCVFHRKVIFVTFNLQLFSLYPLEFTVIFTYCIIHARKFYYYTSKFLSIVAKSHQMHFTNTMVSSSSHAKQPGLLAFSYYDPLPNQPIGHRRNESLNFHLSLLKPSANKRSCLSATK